MIKVSELKGKHVYLAGPYSIGDKLRNTWDMNWVALDLMHEGVIVFNPLLSHFYFKAAEEFTPEWWYQYDLRWVEKCDVLIVLPGESRGAELEAEHAHKLGIPVYKLDELDWEES